MDQEELQKNIALYYSKLSPRMQGIFSGMEWMEKLKKISVKYLLSEEQVQTLGTETMLVLLGIISGEEYEQVLRKEIKISEDIINRMIIEINNSILNILREDLNETFKKNTSEDSSLEELDARFAEVSEETKEAIRTSSYHTTLYEIARGYKLAVPQVVILEKATTDVLLGNIKQEGFERIIKNELGLPEDKQKGLIDTVYVRILKNIRSKIMGDSYKKEEPKIEKEETEILRSHGIEILEDKKEITKPNLELLELEAPHQPLQTSPYQERQEDSFPLTRGNTRGLENPPHPNPLLSKERGEENPRPEWVKVNQEKIIHPILAQKLTIPVKTTVVKTEHTLGNITKSSNPTPSSNIPKAPNTTPTPQPHIIPKPPVSSVIGTIKQASMSTSKLSPSFTAKMDPYRERPE